MATFKVKLDIDQGSDFSKLMTWRTGEPLAAVDLTGCTARMHARSELADPTILLDLTTENGGILLGGVAGTVEIVLAASETEAITWTEAVYDLEIVFPGGRVRRLLKGTIAVSQEVTRA